MVPGDDIASVLCGVMFGSSFRVRRFPRSRLPFFVHGGKHLTSLSRGRGLIVIPD